MGLRQRFLAGTARQLGHPDGWRGRLVARGLNKGNRETIEAAVRAAALEPGQAGADIGFGGGIGLRLLMDAVGAKGRVYGVDVAQTMVEAAHARFAAECAAGVLDVRQGSMLDLPMPDGAVDGAITVNTVYFVADLEAALGELTRILKPGGRLVVGIGDPAMMARMPVTAHGFRLRPPEEILGAMRSAGLGESRHERLEGTHARHLLVGVAPS